MTDNYFKGCPAKMGDARFLTDYRSSTTRDQYNKHINHIVRDDDYRMFLQKNGANIMDKEWTYLRKNESCWPNECIHIFPTRSTPGMLFEEMNLYDNVREKGCGPKCKPQPDYRVSQTPDTRWQ
jgi:hypothetical protein